MSNELAMYEVAVRHPKTREVLTILGQGKTVGEAIGDAVKNALAPYRPSSSGGAMRKIGIGVAGRLAVTLPDGRKVLRYVEAFESGVPFDPKESAP